MAKRDEWYTNPRWDEAARADFDARIRRSRKGNSRAYYFKVKARTLWADKDETPRPHETLDLLERALVESGGDGGVQADLYEELGRFRLAAGDRAAGIAALRRSIEAAASNPRWHRGAAAMLLARCLVDAGDFAGAIGVFDACYAFYDAPYRPRPRYDVLESRDVVSAIGEVYADPDDAAEAIVVYHHAGEPDEPAVPEVQASDRTSIAALDRHFAITEPKFREPLRRPFQPGAAYQREFLDEHFVPELGAFLGRVLVRTAGAEWIVRAPLMKSRIKLGARELNPFRAAFATAFYEIPLAVALEQIESENPRFALP